MWLLLLIIALTFFLPVPVGDSDDKRERWYNKY
mgnify:CR=1 FL=1